MTSFLDFGFITEFAGLDWRGVLILVVLVMCLTTSPTRSGIRLLMACFVLFLAGRYLVWRFETLPDLTRTPLPVVCWQVGFFVVEGLALSGAFLTWLFQSRYVDRSAESTRLAGLMERQPLVDVFIPTYNESAYILERTLCGATAMDYDNYRVWLLDDGKRDEIRDLAEDFGVGYLRRSDNAHAKAGNMNHALRHVLADVRPPELIAILDADFVPTPRFLSRAVPFFERGDVGLVQTPQHFFNPDPLQVNLKGEGLLSDDQRFAQGVDLPARDAWGIATSCGTSSLVRVASLQAIGGFPTESVCEDTLTSVKFWTIGQKTVFLNEILTQGLAVEGIGELLGQRGRWSLGNMQIVRSEWGPFSRHSMPVLARLFLLSLLMGAVISPLMRCLIIVAPILYLFFGVLPVSVDVVELFAYLGPFLFVHYVGMAWLSRGSCLPILTEAITTVEYFSTFRAALVGLLKPLGHKFKVTAKGVERSASVFHWRQIMVLSLPLIAYGVGIYLNLVEFPLNVANAETMIVICAWCYFNSLMLIIAIYLCIDLPRSPHTDLIHLDRPGELVLDGQRQRVIISSLSPHSAIVKGPALKDPCIDQAMTLHVEDFVLPARLEQTNGKPEGRDGLVLRLETDAATRRRLIRRLFSGEMVNSVEKTEALTAFALALYRPLRTT